MMVQFPVESVGEFGDIHRNNVFKRAASVQLALFVYLLENFSFLLSHSPIILVKYGFKCQC